jgi:hypothetical protein
VAEIGERLDLRAFRTRQIALILHDLISSGIAYREFFLITVKDLLLEHSRFDCRVKTGPRLL